MRSLTVNFICCWRSVNHLNLRSLQRRASKLPVRLCALKIMLIHESGTLLRDLHKVLTHDLNMSRALHRCKVKSDAPAPPSPSGFPAPVTLNERVFCHCGPVIWTEPGQPKPDYLYFLTAFFLNRLKFTLLLYVWANSLSDTHIRRHSILHHNNHSPVVQCMQLNGIQVNTVGISCMKLHAYMKCSNSSLIQPIQNIKTFSWAYGVWDCVWMERINRAHPVTQWMWMQHPRLWSVLAAREIRWRDGGN